MGSAQLFPANEYYWFYLAFLGLVFFLLLLDLGIFHRKARAVSLREAAGWTIVWVSLAMLFNFALYKYALWKFPQDPRLMAIPGFDPIAAAKQVGLEFLGGYVIEESLSVDNLFVFVVIFNYFAVPAAYQHRVLFYGILGALICRGAFIGLGAALMQFHWVIWVFGIFLIFTGIKLLFGGDNEPGPEKNHIVRLARRFIPITPKMHGQKFFVRLDNVVHATPLFMCLLVMEMTDVVFAVDSVPAIFAITKEPLVVFTSNIFAILGLRSMYFLLARFMNLFRFLKYGLGLILTFVGLKMVWLNNLERFGGQFPITWSLAIIGSILVASILLSLLFKEAKPDQV